MVKFAGTLIYRFVLLQWWSVWPAVGLPLLAYLKRLLLLSVGSCLFVLIQLMNLIGFLVDEVFYRGYRKTNIIKPVFIIGAPRSGTTFVHRTVSQHPAFTTTTAIDCLLTPGVSQRKLLRLMKSLDHSIGSPVAKLFSAIQKRCLDKVSTDHEFSLTDAEEDFLFLAPLLQCFLLVLPFPRAQWLWDQSCADRHPNSISTRITMRWYRLCVRKHLYCNPQASRYLSKNPTFSGMANLLTETFPDCQLIICERDAPTAVRSQFRVLTPLRKVFANTKDARFDQQLLDTLNFYYTNLDAVKSSLPADRVRAIPLWQLSKGPAIIFHSLFQWLDQFHADSEPVPALAIQDLIEGKSGRRSGTTAYRAPNGVEAAMSDFLPWQVPEEFAS